MKETKSNLKENAEWEHTEDNICSEGHRSLTPEKKFKYRVSPKRVKRFCMQELIIFLSK